MLSFLNRHMAFEISNTPKISGVLGSHPSMHEKPPTSEYSVLTVAARTPQAGRIK